MLTVPDALVDGLVRVSSRHMSAPTLLVTGATGFVGRALLAQLTAGPVQVRAAVRSADTVLPAGVEATVVGDISDAADWSRAVDGVDTVFHLAARVHVLSDRDSNPAAAFRRANVNATLRLAREAARSGVRRLVFVSSIKALGESTPPDAPFDDATPPHPIDPYGVSKLEAERELFAFAGSGGPEVVVLRPPLMVGASASGNLATLARAVARGVPLPFGAVRNRRSLLSVVDFASALRAASTHPDVSNRCFVVADNEDLSTPELIRRLARALGRTARLPPVPPALLAASARALGYGDAAQRLLGSLRVDGSGWQHATGWRPTHGLNAALKELAMSTGAPSAD